MQYISPATMLEVLMRSGVSLRSVAARTGISPTTLVRIRKGGIPRARTFEKIHELYKQRQRELAEDAAFRKENGL